MASTTLTTPKHGELLRFATAGSVDDGKSTLIGRLLYDTKSIFEDQLEQVAEASKRRHGHDGAVDLSLLTDGLRAEREQGITIDVAYRYFATPRRTFIIADTPGHEQYTRNMVTGASTADLALVLVDARNGVVEQSRRHAFISSLLRHPAHRRGRQQDGPRRLERGALRRDRRASSPTSPPSSRSPTSPSSRSARCTATTSSTARPNMPWYDGPPLLAPPRARPHRVGPQPDRPALPRAVGRPPRRPSRRSSTTTARYAGQVAGGRLRARATRSSCCPAARSRRSRRSTPSTARSTRPSRRCRCRSGSTDDVDVSRGDMLAAPNNRPDVGREHRRDRLLDERARRCAPSASATSIKHTTRSTRAVARPRSSHRIDVDTLHHDAVGRRRSASTRSAACASAPPSRCSSTPTAATARPARSSSSTRRTNDTVGAGMIIRRERRGPRRRRRSATSVSRERRPPAVEDRPRRALGGAVDPRRHGLADRPALVGQVDGRRRARVAPGRRGRQRLPPRRRQPAPRHQRRPRLLRRGPRRERPPHRARRAAARRLRHRSPSCSLVSPYAADRAAARQIHEDHRPGRSSRSSSTPRSRSASGATPRASTPAPAPARSPA